MFIGTNVERLKTQKVCHLCLRRSVVCAILFVCVFASMGDTASATHLQRETKIASTTLSDSIKDATVNLYCRLKAGKKTYSASGSGVFVSGRGVILTNAHVAQYFLLPSEKGRVTGRCSVRTGSPAKERYIASMLYFPSVWVEQNASQLSKRMPKGTGENDFALLYITDAKKSTLPEQFPALPIASATRTTTAQEAVTITGYPTEKLNFDKIRQGLMVLTASSTVTGTYSFRRGQSADILALTPSAAGSSGVSGGPVVDRAGKVVGIVTVKSVEKGNRALRAITFSYIDRVIQSQTNLPFSSLLLGDLAMQASTTSAAITPAIIKIISNGLLKKR